MESLRDDFKIFILKILRYYFRIVPQGHNNCQFSIVNCQFGEAVQTPICQAGEIPYLSTQLQSNYFKEAEKWVGFFWH